jgi:hypothetical protein
MKSLPHDPLQSDWPGQELGFEEVGGDTEEGDGDGARGGAGDVTWHPRRATHIRSLCLSYSHRGSLSPTRSLHLIQLSRRRFPPVLIPSPR